MSQDLKNSFEQIALDAGRVLIYGNGGGGDVIQALPLANHLERIGVGEVILGGVNGAWMTDDGHVPQDPASLLLGAEIFDLGELTDTRPFAENLVEVSAQTTLRGRRTAEAACVDLFGRRAVVIGLGNGVEAARHDLRTFVENERIGLVIAADVGSDTFFSGAEANPAKTAFVDYLSIGVLTGVPCSRLFGLGGYGLDGELLLDDLERNVGTVMANGGYVGAIGITSTDVEEMETAIDIFADPVGILVPRAARGEFGWTRVDTNSPWGTPVRVTPLAAVTLIFDPDVMIEHVCTVARELASASDKQTAEEIFEQRLGVVPETQLLNEANLRRTPDRKDS